MANKIRTWTTEELSDFNIIDTTPRQLPLKEVVSVKCAKCENIGRVKFAILRSKKINYGLNWRCRGCLKQERSERGSSMVGEKNPFYGKKHTKECRQAISNANIKKWQKKSPEELRDTMAAIRQIAYEKYGGNPMASPDVKKRYLKAQQDFWSDPERVNERNRKLIETKAFLVSDHYAPKNESKTEREVRDYIESLGLLTKKARISVPGAAIRLEIDVLIESCNLGIEYNGAFMHSERYKHKNYHLIKSETCESHGIQLIQIFDFEWEKSRNQIKEYLRSKLGLNKREYARKCNIIDVDRKMATAFLKENHIQGPAIKSKKFVGLERNGELIALGAFGAHHRDGKTWVMQRFVCKGGLTVVGGLSKISKAASEAIKEDIVSWCDRRWSNGNGYIKAGWQPTHMIPPDYFYIKNGRYYCSKQARRKKAVNTPTNMTEREHARQDGLFRVYDAGKIRFVFKYLS